jgi:hypothetical protein
VGVLDHRGGGGGLGSRSCPSGSLERAGRGAGGLQNGAAHGGGGEQAQVGAAPCLQGPSLA